MPSGEPPLVRSPVELTSDPQFAGRVRRLAVTSAVALGLIWFLSTVSLPMSLPRHRLRGISLAAGWLLMPSILRLSLRWPRLRYGLVVPASLVGAALLDICSTLLPWGGIAATGWLLIATGVVLGGILGVWFWFRWIPVPSEFVDPFSWGRWALILVHILLIIAGLVLVSLAAFA